jgi:hypothetical protein
MPQRKQKNVWRKFILKKFEECKKGNIDEINRGEDVNQSYILIEDSAEE